MWRFLVAAALALTSPCGFGLAPDGVSEQCRQIAFHHLYIGRAYRDYFAEFGRSQVLPGRLETAFISNRTVASVPMNISAQFLRRGNWPLVEAAISFTAVPKLRDSIYEQLSAQFGPPTIARFLLTTPSERIAGRISTATAFSTSPSDVAEMHAWLARPDVYKTEWVFPECDVRVELVEFVDQQDREYTAGLPVYVVLTKIDRQWYGKGDDEGRALAAQLLGMPGAAERAAPVPAGK